MVIRYSESSTKSSFFTMSAKLLVNKLPLKEDGEIAYLIGTARTHTTVWFRLPRGAVVQTPRPAARESFALAIHRQATRELMAVFFLIVSGRLKSEFFGFGFVVPSGPITVFRATAYISIGQRDFAVGIFGRCMSGYSGKVATPLPRFRSMNGNSECSINLRILPLQVLQVPLQVVVGRGSGLQIIVNLSCLLEEKNKMEMSGGAVRRAAAAAAGMFAQLEKRSLWAKET